MELKLETDFLLKNNLSPNEAVLLSLLYEGKNKVVKELSTGLKQDPFEYELVRLKELGYVEGKTALSLKLTEKGKEVYEARDYFQEFLDAFPTSVIRKDGKRAYLKTDKKRSRDKYFKITRKRKDIHEHILKCLKYEVEQRTASGDMMWFKGMPNWLAAEEWENWGERMKDEERIKIFEGEGKDYGSELE